MAPTSQFHIVGQYEQNTSGIYNIYDMHNMYIYIHMIFILYILYTIYIPDIYMLPLLDHCSIVFSFLFQDASPPCEPAMAFDLIEKKCTKNYFLQLFLCFIP